MHMLTVLVNTTWEDATSMALMEKQHNLGAKSYAKTDFTDSGRIIFIAIGRGYANKGRVCFG